MNLKIIGLLLLLTLLSCNARRYGHLTVRTSGTERSVGVDRNMERGQAEAVPTLSSRQSDRLALTVDLSALEQPGSMPLLQVTKEDRVVFKRGAPLDARVLDSVLAVIPEQKAESSNYANFMGIFFAVLLLGLIVWLVAGSIAPNLNWGCLTWMLIIIGVLVIGLLLGLAVVELTK